MLQNSTNSNREIIKFKDSYLVYDNIFCVYSYLFTSSQFHERRICFVYRNHGPKYQNQCTSFVWLK